MPKIVAAAERLAHELGQVRPELDQLALAISALDTRQFDEGTTLRALDAWAIKVLTRGEGAPEIGDLCAVLGEELVLAANPDDYDAPENSFIHSLVGNRCALPILASVIWIEIGRRCGVPLFGIGLPGHFVVGHQPARGELVVVDALNAGTRLTPSAVNALVLRAGSRFHREMLAPATPHSIAVRMLRNLVGSYVRRERFVEARSAAQLWLAASPDDPDVARLFERLDERTQTVWS